MLHDAQRVLEIIQQFGLTRFYLKLRILHLMLGLVQLRFNGAAGDSQGSVGHQHYGKFKLCHIFTCKIQSQLDSCYKEESPVNDLKLILMQVSFT